MKELTIQEMAMVSGGFSLPGFMTSVTAINSYVGSYSYLRYSYLSGNEVTASGVLGAAVSGAAWGGVTGMATLKRAATAIGTASTTGAVEGTFNGKGLIPVLFAKHQQDLDEKQQALLK